MGTQVEPPSARRLATRQKLIDAARTVIAERGISGASLEEICDQAGFTRGAFYSNFATKDDLVVALVNDIGERRKATAFSGSGPVLEASLPQAIRARVAHFFDEESLGTDVILVTELQLWAIRNPEFRHLHHALVDEALEHVRVGLTRFVEACHGEYRIDPESAVRILHASLDYLQLRAFLGEEDRERAVARLTDVVWLLIAPGQA